MVKVVGAALTKFGRRTDGSSFRDWAMDAYTSAIDMAELDPTDITALIVASESDFFTLQLNPASVLATDLGLIGCATTRVEGGGASGQLAVHAGVQLVRSGAANHVAVVGTDPSASTLPPDMIRRLYSYSFDTWTSGHSGVTATALYALSAQIFMAENNLTPTDLDHVTICNRGHALANPLAHLGRNHTVDEIANSPMIASPYRRLHCSPLSDGAAAIILSSDTHAPASRRRSARIAGTGASSDNADLGARAQPGRFTAKTRAMTRACAMADISPEKIGLAEVYDAYAGAQLQAIQALGLTEQIGRDLADGRFASDGALPVNLSGGLMGQGAPVGAVGVGQTASCALFLEGCHRSALQPTDPPAFAVADTHGGIGTTAAVTILAQGDYP